MFQPIYRGGRHVGRRFRDSRIRRFVKFKTTPRLSPFTRVAATRGKIPVSLRLARHVLALSRGSQLVVGQHILAARPPCLARGHVSPDEGIRQFVRIKFRSIHSQHNLGQACLHSNYVFNRVARSRENDVANNCVTNEAMFL